MKTPQKETTGDQTVHQGIAATKTDSAEPVGRSFLDFLAVLTKWRKLIVRIVLVASVLAVTVALISPKWYKATASVLPAESTDMLGGLEGISSLVRNISPSRGLSALTKGSETDRYLAILNSENALLKVIERFSLTQVYDITRYPREKTLKELISNVNFEVGSEGQLAIDVYDKDPQQAADMANYFVKILNDVNSELHVLNARANREFIEMRYNKNLVDLRNSEDSLRAFQIKYGVVALPEQLAASIKAMAEISGMLAIKQVEVDVLRKSLSATHPSVAAAQIEANALQEKIRDLNNGKGEVKGQMNILVPFRLAPDLGVKYVRLFREVEIQNKILQFVTPMYEQAKVEEQRATPSVIVLDYALVPERKAKPKALLYGLIAMVGSTLIALSLVFGIEGARKLRMMDPHGTAALWATVRSDWFGLKWTRRGNS
jgi:tyrosine-protein kinase Etk/Wzc